MNLLAENRKLVLAVGLMMLIIGLVIGSFLGGDADRQSVPVAADGKTTKVQVWTCSMHPQIRMPGPGKCPICAMDLIPLTDDSDEEKLGPRQIKLSETAQKLASIQVTPVERRFAPVETRLVGKIAVDETRRRYITAWVPGRIDRLYVDYTGVPVNEGDHMVYLYSPELLTAQEELIQALRALEQLQDKDMAAIRQTAGLTVKSARERLRLWGVKLEQIAAIEERRQPSDHLTIYAPTGGVVVEKHLNEGEYVQTGTRIYTIADLSQVWLELDAYESDLLWVRFGQQVKFETESYPGEKFSGRISFISPVLDEKTRTIKVRVNVDNTEGRLKPGMFARAVVRARAAASGQVMDPDLAGKWIGPMHPEVVKDGPGSCDICGMPLVKSETLGYMSAATAERGTPLVIPASAVLVTGKRAVVYVAIPDREGVFEGREIELGPRAGDYYLVKEGLREGEQVVVNGSFKIDSALQILARPSMMNPEGGGPPPGHQHGGEASGTTSEQTVSGDAHAGHAPAREAASESQAGHADVEEAEDGHAGHAGVEETAESHVEHAGVEETADDHAGHEPGESEGEFKVPVAFQEQLAAVFSAYFEIQQGLSKDDLSRSAQGTDEIANSLKGVDMALLEGRAHMAWMEHLKRLQASVEKMRQAGDIETARVAFEPLSEAMTAVAGRFGTGLQESVYRFHCPMALGNHGASWLQEAEMTENPYLGGRMYRCGSQEEAFSTTAAQAD